MKLLADVNVEKPIRVVIIEKLFKNYRGKIYNHFVVVTKNKMRFIPLKDLK